MFGLPPFMGGNGPALNNFHPGMQGFGAHRDPRHAPAFVGGQPWRPGMNAIPGRQNMPDPRGFMGGQQRQPAMNAFGGAPNMPDPRAFHQQRQRRASFGGFGHGGMHQPQHLQNFQTREVRPDGQRQNMFDPSRPPKARRPSFGGGHPVPVNEPQQQRPRFFGLFGRGGTRHRNGNLNPPGQPHIDRGNYDIVRRLKEGGMSESIYVVRSRRNGRTYVQKIVRRDAATQKRVSAELATLKSARGHRHLSQLIDHWSLPSGRYCFVIDYCDMGTLQDSINASKQDGRPVREVLLWDVLIGVCMGLHFLHRSSDDTICHLDIKPQNIFFSSQGSQYGLPRVVLADFGCTVAMSDIQNGKAHARIQECGTPHWYPPEGRPDSSGLFGRRRQHFYGTKTDIYMLGATIYVAGNLIQIPPPGLHSMPITFRGAYSQQLKSLVKATTSYEASHRPSAIEVGKTAQKCLAGILRR